MKEIKNITQISNDNELLAIIPNDSRIIRFDRIDWMSADICTDIVKTALTIAHAETTVVNALGAEIACQEYPMSFSMMRVENDAHGVRIIKINKRGKKESLRLIATSHPNYAMFHHLHKGNDYIVQLFRRDGKIEFVTIYLVIE